MSRTVSISSPDNPLVKEVRRAIERGGLTAEGCAIAESFHLLDEALRSAQVEQVLVAESARPTVEERLKGQGIPLAVLADKLFDSISATETSQGVAVLVKPPRWTMADVFGGPISPPASLVVVLDAIQDPGNAGAIVRAAEAFGATGVVFVRGSVSPFNPKTLRGSAGSLFRVPFVSGVLTAEIAAECVRRGVERLAAVPRGEFRSADLAQPCALIIGSEGRGVSDELKAGATPVAIPTCGVESLNAAMAAGILLYEASRQRSGCR